jgi:hypothetical protein
MQEGRVVRFGPRGEIMALYAARKDQQGSAGAAS